MFDYEEDIKYEEVKKETKVKVEEEKVMTDYNEENRYEEVQKVTQVKNEEEKVMTDYNEEIEFEEVQKETEVKVEESKVQEPTMEEKNSLRKDINKMTHKDRILMVNKILNNVGTKTLFVYEEPNYHVEKAAQELLGDWIENDYEILKEEYETYIKENTEE